MEVPKLILEEYVGALTEHAAGTVRVLSDLFIRDCTTDDNFVVFEFEAITAGTNIIYLESALGDAVGFWHPDGRGERSLPADWLGRASTSLVSSLPLGCLYDHAGHTIFGYALDNLIEETDIRYGVSEENKSFVVRLEFSSDSPGRFVRLAVSRNSRSPVLEIEELRDWLVAGVDLPAMAVPVAARYPVYSTWYSFHDGMTAESLEIEAEIAAGLGCGSVFVDFGWQQGGAGRYFDGCGDWIADRVKFPDFAGSVERIHALGLAAVAWISPLMLGESSSAFAGLKAWAPVFNEALRTHILDPRLPAVRSHVAATCERVIREYGLDGLKIDFLETAMAYRGLTGDGDVSDVGVAMQLMLAEIRSALDAAGLQSVIIEFRQPYVSPAIAPYGNVVRVFDCPGDPLINRTSIVDARLSTARQIVHSDMMMWDPHLPAEAVARHLHSALFSVPQISVLLKGAPPEHLRVLKSWLSLWSELRDTLLDGKLSADSPHLHYPTIRADDADGERTVIAVYDKGRVIGLGELSTQTILVNATTEAVVRIDFASATVAQASSFDIHGKPVGTLELPAGQSLVAIPVPPSGWVRITS